MDLSPSKFIYSNYRRTNIVYFCTACHTRNYIVNNDRDSLEKKKVNVPSDYQIWEATMHLKKAVSALCFWPQTKTIYTYLTICFWWWDRLLTSEVVLLFVPISLVRYAIYYSRFIVFWKINCGVNNIFIRYGFSNDFQ